MGNKVGAKKSVYFGVVIARGLDAEGLTIRVFKDRRSAKAEMGFVCATDGANLEAIHLVSGTRSKLGRELAEVVGERFAAKGNG